MATKATPAKKTPTKRAPAKRPAAATTAALTDAAGRATVAALLAKRSDTATGFPERDVTLPGFGTVRVRGLSRHEVLHLQNGPRNVLAIEARTVSMGLIEPMMTVDEVKQWQKVGGAGEIDAVTRAIGELSGMTDKPVKAAYLDFEADPGSEFRVPPSSGTTDDGDSPSA